MVRKKPETKLPTKILYKGGAFAAVVARKLVAAVRAVSAPRKRKKISHT